jgi:L-aminopeptidase/D-esterase-like protein
MSILSKIFIISILCLANKPIKAQDSTKQRGRDLGIHFVGVTGKYNAITDVPGIEVGYKTLICGSGKGAARTGVTVILPKGKTNKSYPAAWFSLNGDGEMTGLPYIEDYGSASGPIAITVSFPKNRSM